MILTRDKRVLLRPDLSGVGNIPVIRNAGAIFIPPRVRVIVNLSSESFWIDHTTTPITPHRVPGPSFLIDGYMDNRCRSVTILEPLPGQYEFGGGDNIEGLNALDPQYNRLYSDCAQVSQYLDKVNDSPGGSVSEVFNTCITIDLDYVGFAHDLVRGNFVAFIQRIENLFDFVGASFGYGNYDWGVITGITTPERVVFFIAPTADADIGANGFGLSGSITLIPEYCQCALGPFGPPACAGGGSGSGDEESICAITDCSLTMPKMVNIEGDLWGVNVSGGVVGTPFLVQTGLSATSTTVGGDNCNWYSYTGDYTPPSAAPTFYPTVGRFYLDDMHCEWRISDGVIPDIGVVDLLDNFKTVGLDVRGTYSDPPDPSTLTFPSDGTYYYLKNASVG